MLESDHLNKSSKVFCAGQGKASRSFAPFLFFFETGFHYTPEATSTLQQSSCFSLLSACSQQYAMVHSKQVSRRSNWQTPNLLGRNSTNQHGSPHGDHFKASLHGEVKGYDPVPTLLLAFFFFFFFRQGQVK